MRNRNLALRGFAVAAVLAVLVAYVPAGLAAPAQPPDTASIRQETQRLIDWLDSPAYAAAATWDEHAVLSYRLAQGRDPTLLEFFLLRALHDETGLTRSTALSVALRGNLARPTWEQCRTLAAEAGPERWVVDGSVRETAARLAAVPLWQVAQALRESLLEQVPQPAPALPDTEPSLAGAAFQTYFGYTHAHSGVSDGTGTPLDAYTYARDTGGLDFFALTDHGEMIDVWPWEGEWQAIVDAANATNQAGSFVALWGFEWSNPVLGHINILNSGDNTGAVSTFDLNAIYDWLAARPAAIGFFNHPGEYDLLGTEFYHLALYSPARLQMVGIENWNSGNSFDSYYYSGSWESAYSYWDAGNRQGWFLGAQGGQDNHSADWGTRNGYRTAVLSQGLSRAKILAAYRARRFYATEDPDLLLDLRCGGYPMGSRLTGVPRQFRVIASDPSGDAFQEVRLYRNGDLVQTKAVSGTSFSARFADTGYTAPAYYYVIVRLAVDQDGNGRGDEAISSPIWIQ